MTIKLVEILRSHYWSVYLVSNAWYLVLISIKGFEKAGSRLSSKGLPQGSVLSLLLFIIYVAGLNDVIDKDVYVF